MTLSQEYRNLIESCEKYVTYLESHQTKTNPNFADQEKTKTNQKKTKPDQKELLHSILSQRFDNNVLENKIELIKDITNLLYDLKIDAVNSIKKYKFISKNANIELINELKISDKEPDKKAKIEQAYKEIKLIELLEKNELKEVFNNSSPKEIVRNVELMKVLENSGLLNAYESEKLKAKTRLIKHALKPTLSTNTSEEEKELIKEILTNAEKIDFFIRAKKAILEKRVSEVGRICNDYLNDLNNEKKNASPRQLEKIKEKISIVKSFMAVIDNKTDSIDHKFKKISDLIHEKKKNLEEPRSSFHQFFRKIVRALNLDSIYKGNNAFWKTKGAKVADNIENIIHSDNLPKLN
ncbi:hypothetical protein [Legionella fairfieldensis]|uniref:hypothetical protein n=1 Tax=Legionella fairfieldensis TaxID=45064 RepID=UPI0004917673|nr:hypothetical protein [Legionella fairfieldensis]